MRGFKKDSKEYKALKRFLKKKAERNGGDVSHVDCGKYASVLVSIWKDYGRGFIGCEMHRIAKLEGLIL